MGVGVGFGVINGLLISRLRLPPFIVTLGSLTAVRGLARLMGADTTVFNADIPYAFVGNNSIPIIPAILQSLLAELNQPPEQVNMLRVADLVGRDESLAAQCLRMANSPLFGRGTPTVSMRGAVRTFGIDGGRGRRKS